MHFTSNFFWYDYILNKVNTHQLKMFMTKLKHSLSFITCFLLSLYTFAQEKKIDVDIDVNKKNSDWYMQPWVWVVAAAVFILILVALLRGKKSE